MSSLFHLFSAAKKTVLAGVAAMGVNLASAHPGAIRHFMPGPRPIPHCMPCRPCRPFLPPPPCRPCVPLRPFCGPPLPPPPPPVPVFIPPVRVYHNVCRPLPPLPPPPPPPVPLIPPVITAPCPGNVIVTPCVPLIL